MPSPLLSALPSYRGYRPLPPCRPRAAEAADQSRQAEDRPRVVARHEVVHVREDRPHPHGEGLHVDVRRPRVDPDKSPCLELEPPGLAGEQLGVPPVPAIAAPIRVPPDQSPTAALACSRARPTSRSWSVVVNRVSPVANTNASDSIPAATAARSEASRTRENRSIEPETSQSSTSRRGRTEAEHQAGRIASPSVRRARLTVRRRSSLPRCREERTRRESRSGWARRSASPRA